MWNVSNFRRRGIGNFVMKYIADLARVEGFTWHEEQIGADVRYELAL